MTRVRVLDDVLVNRIAAGEVVERPASVVKELVENSIDAGAGRVEVELVNGGRRLIRVIDDGSGMDEDDALLALERHATSKLDSADDLVNIATFGFRGEALPSIAAASRVALTTCADTASGGVRVTVEGGRILGVEPMARPRGTTVEVSDLFFNLPARRKFLHAPETELRHAQEAVWSASLARPDVGFVLRHGNRTLIEVPEAVDRAARLGDLLRGRTSGSIHRFEGSGGGIEVEGLLAEGRGSGRAELTLLVNGRPVKDRLLVGAALRVLRAAGSGLGGARIVIAVTLPHDMVDVNVHPAKTEVRFARAGAVFVVVERALRAGIAASRGEVPVRSLDEATQPAATEPDRSVVSGQEHPAAARTAPLFPHPAYDTGAETPTGPTEPEARHPAPDPFESSSWPPEPGPPSTRPAAQVAAWNQPARPLDRRGAGAPAAPITSADPYIESTPFSQPGHEVSAARRSGARAGAPDTPFGRLIGQYRRSFLLLEDREGLVIVDQHVAHERVLYDRIRQSLAGERVPSQGLLEPVLIEVDEALAAALPRIDELLERVGICAELFGHDTVRLTALPVELQPAEAEELLLELLRRATDLDGVPERITELLEDELAAGLSCRAAIKVNHELAPEAQRALLRDLAATENPYRCPHGRPIVLRLTQEEMERRLGRR